MRLTTNEKVTTVISIIALVVAAASPFMTYQWFQNSIKEQNLKANGFKASGIYTQSYDDDASPKASISYHVDLSNDGPLAVDKVMVSMKKWQSKFDESIKNQVSVNPPAKFNVTAFGDTLIITLEDPLPPGQKVLLTVSFPLDPSKKKEPMIHPFIWVTSEATPSNQLPLQSGGSDNSGSL